jgi:hypothetical protein
MEWNWQGRKEVPEENPVPSPLFHTNPTQTGLRVNPSLRGYRTSNNHLSNGKDRLWHWAVMSNPYFAVFITCTICFKIKQIHFEEAEFLGPGTVSPGWCFLAVWRKDTPSDRLERLAIRYSITSLKTWIHKNAAVETFNHTTICILLIRIQHSFWIYNE